MFAPRVDIRCEVRRDARSDLVVALQAVPTSVKHWLLEVRVVLGLFFGFERWSGAAAAAAGEYVLSIDICFDSELKDLSRRPLQSKILGWLQARFIKYVLAGFPCRSFS